MTSAVTLAPVLRSVIGRTVVLSLMGALAACGERVEDHAERTGNAIAADVHAATGNVVESVDRLTDTMANSLDSAAARSLDRAADRLDGAADRLRDDVRRHGDEAADRAGAALQQAGDDLRDRDDTREGKR